MPHPLSPADEQAPAGASTLDGEQGRDRPPGPAHPVHTVDAPAEQVVAEVAELLRARGERMTGPRRAVLLVLARDAGHHAAEDVVRAVAALDPGVHRASVYRTLEALGELGVLQHVHVGHGGTAYHLLRRTDPHLHASCRSCGAVTDLPGDLLDDVAARVLASDGFVLEPTHVALSGTCARCAGEARGHGPH
ncbi:Fur family transcriptional regulator [Aquipuribacter hungaricus]|uniref:Fur family transcriptional regulator n=1 Tax=Aquipuribacter hungaricus TaxID=545624 RepID=A0ABV7WIM2_9MICO